MPTTHANNPCLRHIFLFGTVWAFGIHIEAANGADIRGDLSAAAAAYYQGRVEYAIKKLTPLADQEVAISASLEGKQVFEYILDLCVGGWDFRCIAEYAPKYEALVQSLTALPEALKLPFAMQPAYYYGVEVWLSGDHAKAQALLNSWPENIEVPWVPRDYIRRQLMRGRLYLMLDQRDAARLCVDRALMSIASIENSGSSLMELSAWLVEAIDDLLELGDTERAIGLSLTNATVGQKVFPLQSIEYFRLLRVSSEVYIAAGLIPQAKDAADRALEVLSHLELDPDVQKFLAADAYTAGSLICAFANDLDCAKRLLHEHPMYAQMPEIRMHGVLQSFQEVSYLATRALVDAASGGTTDAEDVVLLAKPMASKITLPEEVAEAARIYQRCGHALAVMRSNPEGAAAQLRALSSDLIRLESKRTDAFGLLPKRSTVDQLILSLVANAFRGDRLETDAGDMVVRLLDLAARNGQSYASEALSFMSVARTDDSRNELRELLRLRSRRDSAERLDIARMLSEKPNVDPSGNVVEPTASFQRRAIYSDYDSLIAKLLVQLRADQPDLTAADIPPSLEEIQGSLRDNEVVIGAPPLVGGLMGHLCISRTMVRFVTSTEDLPRFSRDIRILEAALSSENQPSEEADREYPIGAARHLYDTLLKPVDGCFHPGDSVVWVGAGPGTVPLAALLSQGTVAELQSKRLAEWPWFVSEASISQVSTLSTLVALRRGRRASVEDATAQFLGIGDPDFSGLPDSANEVAQLALRGAVGIGNLSVLPELPDTRTEIVSISTLFPGRKTLLLGNQATEGDLRRLPLERYAYLEFATHGLVRQDISGLTEPALALSPVSSVDSFDDGLLTASEIADLPLNAKFVALSACNTGVLDTSKFASEVPGLAAAFEVAGVPATLGTLWPVDSDASRQIVQDTFRRVIGDRVGPAVALAEAQRQYLRHSTSIAHEHPRFWAPFAIFGDGTAPTGESIESSPVQIGAVRLLTDTGGEVFSLTDDGAGSLFLRAIGDIRSGPRHASLTIGLRKDFSVKWAKEDPVVGSSPVATRVDGGHIVAGYRGDGDTPSVATIQFMDDSGQIQQEWNVARPSEDMLPMSGLRVGSRGALIAIYQHVRNPDANGTWPSSHVVIVEVQVGQPLRVRTDLEVGTDVLSFVGLQWLGNDVLVVTADSNSLRLPKLYLNDYHQMMPCGLEPHSSIAVLQHGTLSKIWSQDLPDVQFANTLRAGDGSVRIVGSEVVGCGDGTRIGLWNISNDRVLTKVFLDQTPRESQARGLLQKPDGSMLLLGRSRRTTDVDSLEERDPQKVIANTSRRMNVSFSSRHIDDAVIISLDRSLNVKSRVTLRAGSDLSMAGAISLDDDTWLYGALGNQAAIMQVTGLH